MKMIKNKINEHQVCVYLLKQFSKKRNDLQMVSLESIDSFLFSKISLSFFISSFLSGLEKSSSYMSNI